MTTGTASSKRNFSIPRSGAWAGTHPRSKGVCSGMRSRGSQLLNYGSKIVLSFNARENEIQTVGTYPGSELVLFDRRVFQKPMPLGRLQAERPSSD
jgi:hypothetical protein